MKEDNNSKKITIAIDGHSSCGKSTLAKELAEELGYIYIDSGAMYRGVALFCKRNGWVTTEHLDVPNIVKHLDQIQLRFVRVEGQEKPQLMLNGELVEKEIRSMEISKIVSPIATVKEVRKKLVQEQREMGKTGGVIMDGRDIGSVVFPKAELKIFLTASASVRARRRYDELAASGSNATLEEIKINLLERDEIDSTRTESPLIKTEDAWVLDNSNLTKNEQLELVLAKIREILAD